MEYKRSSRSLFSSTWRPFLTIVLTAIITGLICGLIGIGMLKQASPHRYHQVLRSIPQIPAAVFRHLTHARAEAPTLHLHVNHLNLQKLAYEREQFFMQEKDIDYEFVAGDLQWNEETYPIKIRLKGDRYIHVSDLHRWSFRVHAKEKNAIMGMKYFSLHRAGARNYLYEWLFHRLLKQEGFVALRYQFVNVSLNGKALGIYAMEEHFDKRLIEHNQFREGPILKFDESLTGDWLNMSVVRPFRPEQYQDSAKRSKLERATALLEQFRRGEAGLSKVFDVNKLATFFALTDVLSVKHGSMWKSIRFYYNPISDRIEPIGFDGHFNPELSPRFFLAAQTSQQPSIGLCREAASWYDHVFFPSDTIEEEFFTAYIDALDRVSQEAYIRSFLADNQEEIQQNLGRIFSDYPTEADHILWYGPDMHFFSEEVFFQKARYIQSTIRPNKSLLFAFKQSASAQNVHVQVSNVHTLPLTIKSLFIDSVKVPITPPVSLVPRPFSDFVEYTPGYQTISVKLPNELDWKDSMWQKLELAYSVLGIEKEERVEVAPWRRDIATPQSMPMHETSTIDQFPFLSVNEEARSIMIDSGNWVIDRDLIIPRGYTVHCSPGTWLDLTQQAAIISHSPLKWVGTEDAPIVLTNKTGTGQGLMLFQAEGVSSFIHVDFWNLSPPKRYEWELTGTVTVYESEVRFENVSWHECKGEDAVNIVRSKFEMNQCAILNASSDAVDLDFCTGSLRECWILYAGNDGLDISGSTILLSGLTIEHTGDKGISIGEDAEVEARQLKIGNVRTGLAIKDQSHLFGSQFRLDSCQIGWAIYEKKAEYGPASAVLNQVVQSHVEIPSLIELGSSCELDGLSFQGELSNVIARVDSSVVD